MTTESKKSSTSVSKTVFLYRNMADPLQVTAGVFTTKIDLNFTPDEVVVRQIIYRTPVTIETGVFLLYSDLISGFLGSFIDGAPVNPHTSFPLKSFTNNTYTFRVQDSAVDVDDAMLGTLCVVLEFRTF